MLKQRILFLIVSVSLASMAFAMAAGRVRGTVKDPEGKPLEKVMINIESTNVEKPQKYTAKTNAKGEYIHIGVSPGNYRITPSKEGYTPVNYGYIDLNVPLSDKPVVADFTMQLSTGAQQLKTEESEQIKEAKAGVSLLNEGKVDEAIVAFNKALQIDPNLASVQYNMGIAYEKKNQPEEARKHFEEAIKIKADFGEAYFALGNNQMTAKNFDGGVEALAKAAEYMPQDYAAFYNLGVCYSNSGKFAEAEAAYRKAAEISPNQPIVHYQLGMSLLGQSKTAEAKEEFRKYLDLNPNAVDKKEVEELLQTL